MAELVDLVDRALELVGPGEREDLRRRLEQTRERLSDPSIRVIVVGEFKQGKSRLVNALVNAPVCAVDDDIATSAPTVVKQGATPSAVVRSASTISTARRSPGCAERQSAATARSASASRPTRTRSWLPARARAVAAPIPREAPVMTTVLMPAEASRARRGSGPRGVGWGP